MDSTDNTSRRVQLRVMGLSVSQIKQGAYALILQQVNGPVHIPVVIGVPEAQAIAMQMEKVVPPRPLTHDLFAGFCRGFGVVASEVFINSFEDGVFTAEITLSDGTREVVLDARASDAIALAMRLHAPIFTTPEILRETGFVVDSVVRDGDAEPTDEAQELMLQSLFTRLGDDSAGTGDDDADDLLFGDPDPDELPELRLARLQAELDRAIAAEDYERAATITEIIRREYPDADN